MRRYSEAVKADVRRRMSPPHRQSVARISEELGIHVITLHKWRKTWRLQGEVVPASKKEPDGWSAADKFTVVLETAWLNATELGAYCRERGLFPEQVGRWRQTATDANAKPVLTMAEQKELEMARTPETDPALMRASTPARLGQEKPHETQAPQPRADHPQAAHR